MKNRLEEEGRVGEVSIAVEGVRGEVPFSAPYKLSRTFRRLVAVGVVAFVGLERSQRNGL